MIIDHIGIVVKSISSGIIQWSSLFGYRQTTSVTINKLQKVKVVFMQKKGSIDIKLIEPTDESSPVFNFAKQGGGLHHLCYYCEDIEKKIRELKKLGCRVIANPQPGEEF